MKKTKQKNDTKNEINENNIKTNIKKMTYKAQN